MCQESRENLFDQTLGSKQKFKKTKEKLSSFESEFCYDF